MKPGRVVHRVWRSRPTVWVPLGAAPAGRWAMRTGWSIACVFALLGWISGCGDQAEVHANAAVPNTTTIGTVARVISAPGGGFVYAVGDTSAGLYTFKDSGLEQVATLSAYRSPIATSIGDVALVGGIRCTTPDPCAGWVAEVTRVLLPSGKNLGTTEVARGSSAPEETTGLGLAGLMNGQAVLLADSGIQALGQNGELTPLAPWPPPGRVCPIGDALYAIAVQEQTGSTPQLLPAAGTTTGVVGSIAKYEGGGWQVQPGGAIEQDIPAPAGITCGSQAILTQSGDIAHGSWTPTTGFTTLEPSAPNPDASFNTSSTQQTYALTPSGELINRGPNGKSTGLGFSAPSPDAAPAQLLVDDSGGPIFACISYANPMKSQDPARTQCQRTSA